MICWPRWGWVENEILSVSHPVKMTVANVLNYTVYYASLFEWAKKERLYREENPFESLAPEDPIPPNQNRDHTRKD